MNAHQASLSVTNSQSPPKPMSIESVMLSNHLILCCPLLYVPSIFPSIRDFSNESALCIRWPKSWSFNFNISPTNEHPGLISFRMDWLDLLAVQRTLKSLLQHHSSKASILQHSAFFIVQLSHPYVTTGKTIALTRRTFVDKVMSLVFNMLSRLVITFLPRSKCLLISWLQSPSAVILEPRKVKSDTVSIVSPSISHEVIGPEWISFYFSLFDDLHYCWMQIWAQGSNSRTTHNILESSSSSRASRCSTRSCRQGMIHKSSGAFFLTVCGCLHFFTELLLLLISLTDNLKAAAFGYVLILDDHFLKGHTQRSTLPQFHLCIIQYQVQRDV